MLLKIFHLLSGEGVKLVAAHGDLLVQSLHARPATRSTAVVVVVHYDDDDDGLRVPCSD